MSEASEVRRYVVEHFLELASSFRDNPFARNCAPIFAIPTTRSPDTREVRASRFFINQISRVEWAPSRFFLFHYAGAVDRSYRVLPVPCPRISRSPWCAYVAPWSRPPYEYLDTVRSFCPCRFFDRKNLWAHDFNYVSTPILKYYFILRKKVG